MCFLSHEISLAVLESDTDVSCVLDPAGRIVYCNPSWDRFAASNGGGEQAFGAGVCGRSFLDFVPPVLKHFFAGKLLGNMAPYMIWDHYYECSTPEEFRVYRLQAMRLKDTDEILLAHTPYLSRAHHRRPVEPGSQSGPVTMCAHCRQTQQAPDGADWAWIPEYLAHPPVTSPPDLCPECKAHYRAGADFWYEPAPSLSRSR